MLEFRDFDEKYLEDFRYEGVEKRIALWLDLKAYAARQARLGVAYMGFIDGKLAGFGGIYPLWYGVGQAWFVTNPEAKPYIRQIITYTKRIISATMVAYNFHRVQAYALIDEPKATKMLELLGFIREGTLKMFSPNKEDMVMYCILKR